MRLVKFTSAGVVIHVNPDRVALVEGGDDVPTEIHFDGDLRYHVDQSLADVVKTLEG